MSEQSARIVDTLERGTAAGKLKWKRPLIEDGSLQYVFWLLLPDDAVLYLYSDGRTILTQSRSNPSVLLASDFFAPEKERLARLYQSLVKPLLEPEDHGERLYQRLRQMIEGKA